MNTWLRRPARGLLIGGWPLIFVLTASACVDLGREPGDAGSEPDSRVTAADAGTIVDVAIARMMYSPREVSIRAGSTVRWTNLDPVEHTVTEGAPNSPIPPAWSSPRLGGGGTFQYTFAEPGEWTYFCIPHSSMPTMRDAVVRVY